MQTIIRDVRGIPEEALAKYLAAVGGTLQPDGSYTGPGWQARLIPLPDYVFRSTAFCQVRVEFTGDARAVREIWPRFEIRILRPGG